MLKTKNFDRNDIILTNVRLKEWILMSETIFSKILSGDIPSYKVYEDDYVYAF